MGELHRELGVMGELHRELGVVPSDVPVGCAFL